METAVWFLGLRGSNICLSTWKYQRRNPHKTRENETISSASDFGSSERIFLDSLYNRSYCRFKCFNMLFFTFLIGLETWITRLTKVQKTYTTFGGTVWGQAFCTLLLPLSTVFWVFGNLIIGLLTHWRGSFISPFNKSRYLTFLTTCKQRHAPMGLIVSTVTNIITCVAGIRGTKNKERNGSRLPSSFLRLLHSTAYQYHNVRPRKLTHMRPTQGAIWRLYARVWTKRICLIMKVFYLFDHFL